MSISLPIIDHSIIKDNKVLEWYVKKRTVKVQPPSILQLEVTKNCNLRCIMCHKGQMPPGQDFIRTDISDLVLEKVKPIFPFLKHAMLFGDGEPMVYKNFWNIVSDIRSASKECCIDFINNGTMMHDKNIQKCLDYKVSHMGLSLGGASSESHNYIRKDSDFENIISNFYKLKIAKESRSTFEPYVTALMVVMKSNYREIPSFVEMCAELGFYDIHLQKLFVTHPSMKREIVNDETLIPYLREANIIAKNRKIGFIHYPVGEDFSNDTRLNFDINDVFFKEKTEIKNDHGYCLYQQPWNTIYVLHDGKVVPDCHWWFSSQRNELNYCGILNEHNDIFDIWNGPVYNLIRSEVVAGNILPQCRGCGLAGGVVQKYRSELTDHIDPNQENVKK